MSKAPDLRPALAAPSRTGFATFARMKHSDCQREKTSSRPAGSERVLYDAPYTINRDIVASRGATRTLRDIYFCGQARRGARCPRCASTNGRISQSSPKRHLDGSYRQGYLGMFLLSGRWRTDALGVDILTADRALGCTISVAPITSKRKEPSFCSDLAFVHLYQP